MPPTPEEVEIWRQKVERTCQALERIAKDISARFPELRNMQIDEAVSVLCDRVEADGDSLSDVASRKLPYGIGYPEVFTEKDVIDDVIDYVDNEGRRWVFGKDDGKKPAPMPFGYGYGDGIGGNKPAGSVYPTLDVIDQLRHELMEVRDEAQIKADTVDDLQDELEERTDTIFRLKSFLGPTAVKRFEKLYKTKL
jgi:uncharacterized protein YukE